MPFKNTKILEFNQIQKSDKATFVIYADLESFIRKNWTLIKNVKLLELNTKIASVLLNTQTLKII